MDFEKDPALRAVLPAQISGATSSKLEELLDKAALSVHDSTEEAAFFKAQARYQAVQELQQKKQRRAIDIALSVLIFILVTLVLSLFLINN